MQNSKQPSSFVNKKEQSFLQPLGTRDDFKDEILLNDLELYYKNGTFPSVFFLHIACALLTTFIIISESYHLNNLMQHTRIIQSVFYFHHKGPPLISQSKSPPVHNATLIVTKS